MKILQFHTVYLGLAVALSVITTSVTDKCCGPKEWTSQVSQVFGEYKLSDDFYTLNDIFNTMYYDYGTKRVAFEQVVVNETGPLLSESLRQSPIYVKQIIDFKIVS